jgi:hypothetical protein
VPASGMIFILVLGRSIHRVNPERKRTLMPNRNELS